MSLYVPNSVPLNYKYIRVGSNYIDFFDRGSAQNVTLTYYRQYFNISPDLVFQRQETFGNYNTTYFNEVETSHNIMARTDVADIFLCVGFSIIAIIFTINFITSIIKKGGLLGGLL